VGAFYLGGLTAETRAATSGVAAGTEATTALTTTGTAGAPEVAVECEPGQRAVVRTTAGAPPSVVCQSDPRPVSGTARFASPVPAANVPGVVRVADWDDRPYARPAVITEPVEVYRPRTRQVSGVTAPKRTTKKSVAIIAGSTTAGAVVGGLVKGTKGAVIGGLLGGGAAAVWDQATRRQHDVR
jgi:hypothetical protein